MTLCRHHISAGCDDDPLENLARFTFGLLVVEPLRAQEAKKTNVPCRSYFLPRYHTSAADQRCGERHLFDLESVSAARLAVIKIGLGLSRSRRCLHHQGHRSTTIWTPSMPLMASRRGATRRKAPISAAWSGRQGFLDKRQEDVQDDLSPSMMPRLAMDYPMTCTSELQPAVTKTSSSMMQCGNDATTKKYWMDIAARRGFLRADRGGGPIAAVAARSMRPPDRVEINKTQLVFGTTSRSPRKASLRDSDA